MLRNTGFMGGGRVFKRTCAVLSVHSLTLALTRPLFASKLPDLQELRTVFPKTFAQILTKNVNGVKKSDQFT
jgi:hypothetical protein